MSIVGGKHGDGRRVGNAHWRSQCAPADRHGPALFRARRLAFGFVVAVVAGCWVEGAAPVAFAQPAPVPLPPVTAPALTEPVYWKQHLFLIPYQWGSAAQSSAARSVALFVSKDRGATWQKISDAKPQVTAFNYRAEGDGEYWFAVRTLDAAGRMWPAGPYQPELRVIVDTTIPRIDALRAQPTANGAIEIECQATDVNLDWSSLKVEAQTGAGGLWQVVAVQQGVGGGERGVGNTTPGFGAPLRAVWQPPAGVRPAAIRVAVSDRAGNSAVYQSPIGGATPTTTAGPLLPQPSLSATTGNPFDAAIGTNTASPAVPSGPSWTPGAPAAAPAAAPAPAPAQPWAAGAMARAPFRLWTSGTSQRDDGMTAYGNPTVSNAAPSNAAPISNTVPAMPSVAAAPTNSMPTAAGENRVPAHYAGMAKSDAAPSDSGWTPGPNGPQFAPLEPFRETGPIGATEAAAPTPLPLSAATATNRPAVQPKQVGSRTFALEYDLDGLASAVSKVELWGTRDGGKSWNRYAQDDDNRSPIICTVDDEGTYGFKILVQNAGGAVVDPPRAGEQPELWVSVDLKRPIVELTSVERGEGNMADHLILHWRVQDNNLEQRPISLYFSSRPSGPWSAIATNLEDTGEYAWRVERYVPTRIYLRIEARDTAGNLSAFQTREPVEFTSQAPIGRLRSTPPGASR